MKKHILTWDFLYIILVCIFSGMVDGYGFVARNGTLSLIQSGNLVKSIVAFVENNFYEGIYFLILIFVFCLFLFIFDLLISFLKKRKINYNYFLILLIMLLLIPSFVWEFNSNNYLDYKNVLSSSFLSMIGSLIMIIFRSVRFKLEKKITFNAAVMSGNIRFMMKNLSDFVKTKNKEFGYRSFFYFLMILTFGLGVSFSAIGFYYIIEPWNINSLWIIIYILLVFIVIVLNFRYKWIKNYKRNTQEEQVD